MARLCSTCTLVFACLVGTAAQADWSYDFDNGMLPDDLIVEDNYYPGEQPSPTFEGTVEDDGYLLLSDPVARSSGGAVRASAKNSEVFTDVRVSAVINPTGDIPCVFQGVSARRTPGSAYYAAVVNAPGYGNSGNFAIGKNADSYMVQATDFGYQRLTDFSIPYRIELEVVTEHDAEIDKDYAVIAARLFDATTDALIYDLGFEDYSKSGLPPFLSGNSAAFTIDTWSSISLAAAFDDISSVSLILPGDYNRDQTLDTADLDLQASAIVMGNNPPEYDLTDDGLVNIDDRVVWVRELKSTWFGDADLDGEFNSADLIRAFVAGKYETGENAGWAEGDWNGNGIFDSSDMVAAFVDGGYEKGPRANVAAVPEPGALLLVLVSGVLCCTYCRRFSVADRRACSGRLPGVHM